VAEKATRSDFRVIFGAAPQAPLLVPGEGFEPPTNGLQNQVPQFPASL
jgi:hypothetical protein